MLSRLPDLLLLGALAAALFTAPIGQASASETAALACDAATAAAVTTEQTCCRVCKKGKACGDSCISRSYTCTRPAGCACNG